MPSRPILKHARRRLRIAGLILWAGCAVALAQQARDAPATPAILAPADVAAPPGAVDDSGLAMKVLKPGSGTDHPSGNDCVVLSFTAWKRDGSLFSTSGRHGETMRQCLTAAIPGVTRALSAMVVGEKLRVWVPAQLAFDAHVAHHGLKDLHEDPPPRVDLTIDLELFQILKAPLTPTDLSMPPPTALKLASGVALEVLHAGVGFTHPSMNSRVTVNYTGWTADGELFESTVMSNHPAVILLGTALAGLREALPLMVVGEKARIWIPANSANGEHPVGMIPAGDLVYDMELLAFQ